MARQKKPVHRVEMTEGKRNIIRQLLEEYDIETAEDIQDALKDLLGGTIKEMMEAEMDEHLGYEKSERSDNDDYRNGYKRKQVNSRYGSMAIEVPQDRKSTFEPQIVKKRQKDISDIDQKIISMYAKGMTTRQISETIEDIYGFETSESFISVSYTHLDVYKRQLLLLSRLDAGTLFLEKEAVDVFTVLTLAADNLQEVFSEADVSLNIPCLLYTSRCV